MPPAAKLDDLLSVLDRMSQVSPEDDIFDVLDAYGEESKQVPELSAPESVSLESTSNQPQPLPRGVPRQTTVPALSIPTPVTNEVAALRMELERAKMELRDKEQMNQILMEQQEVENLRLELERAKLELQEKHQISQVLMARKLSQKQTPNINDMRSPVSPSTPTISKHSTESDNASIHSEKSSKSAKSSKTTSVFGMFGVARTNSVSKKLPSAPPTTPKTPKSGEQTLVAAAIMKEFMF